MIQDFGKWPESSWTSSEIDWKQAESITAGVDVGTTSTQAVIIVDGALFGYANLHTESDFGGAADTAIERAMGHTGMTLNDIGNIAATGFGSKNVTCATKQLDEIQCHGKGARFMFGGNVKTVVDLGGQFTKAITLYNWDRVREFKVNDKCATGLGRNIETMSNLFQVPIVEMGKKSLDVAKDPEPVSTTCYAFAETEAMGLFRQGFREDKYTENDVLASYLFTIAWRALSTIGKLAPLDIGDIQLESEIGFTGGLAKNEGVTKRLERELKMTALSSDIDPQLAGAIGAALLA